MCAVTNPLQLISAVEYLYFLRLDVQADLLILATGRKLKMLIYTAKNKYSDCFFRIDWIDIGEFNPRKNLIKSILNAMISKYKINNYLKSRTDEPVILVLGHTPPYEIGLIAKKTKTSPIFVDDGIRTLQYLSDKEFRENCNRSSGKLLSADGLLKNIYGTSDCFKNASNFFTSFYEEADKEDISCIRNDFSHLKMGSSKKIIVEEHHFIGQPLVECNLIAASQYVKYILNIKARSDVEFKYFPHPAEGEKNLNELVKNGINVQNNYFGYEDYFLGLEFVPKLISSFYSSTLVILSKLNVDSDLCYFDISGDFLKKCTKKSVDNFYKKIMIPVKNIGKI